MNESLVIAATSVNLIEFHERRERMFERKGDPIQYSNDLILIDMTKRKNSVGAWNLFLKSSNKRESERECLENNGTLE